MNRQGRTGNPSSARWRLRAGRTFPGGVNSPVRAYRAVDGKPPILVRGAGSRVWDVDGREFIDYVGAYGPFILGHADPRVVDAVRQAALDGGPFGATHPSEVRLAELIQAAMPSIELIRFVSSGTEAVMSALRVARAWTGRDLIAKFDGGYHGHADGLLVRAGSGLATLALPASAGVGNAVAAETLIARYNDLRSVAALFETHRGRIAAVIVEPVAANMGVVAPVPGFLEGLRQLTSDHGTALIFDEVITGFRVARGGAQARYGVEPDLTTLGKVIGGGLPIGAYGGRREPMELVAPVGPVYQAGTLAGHPLAMAAGEATVARLDDALYERVDIAASRLEAGLLAAAESAGVAASVGRVGSLLTLFFRAGPPPRDAAETRSADARQFAAFHAGMDAQGILLPPSQYEAWFVSASHSAVDIDRTVEAAEGALRTVAGARRGKGKA